MLAVRPAKIDDLDAITEIYNEAILTTDATFDIEPKTEAEQETWFASHGPQNPDRTKRLDKMRPMISGKNTD